MKGGIENVSQLEFKGFAITEGLVKDLELAWTLGKEQRIRGAGLTMQEIDEKIEVWEKTNSTLKAELLKEYRIYFETDYFPFSEFETIYNSDPEKRICHYCSINDKEIELLDAKGQIKTKRGRGFTMEIDRIKPNYEYSKDNVVLACYWCNNAKTDEFSEPEFFYHIGLGIGKVWNLRKESKK